MHTELLLCCFHINSVKKDGRSFQFQNEVPSLVWPAGKCQSWLQVKMIACVNKGEELQTQVWANYGLGAKCGLLSLLSGLFRVISIKS